MHARINAAVSAAAMEVAALLEDDFNSFLWS